MKALEACLILVVIFGCFIAILFAVHRGDPAMTDRTHADVIRPALVYTNTLYPDALAALDALLAERDAATERAEASKQAAEWNDGRALALLHRAKTAEAQLAAAREALTAYGEIAMAVASCVNECGESTLYHDLHAANQLGDAALAASGTPPEREPPEPKDVGRLTEATDIAKNAVAFWVRDYDHTGTPAGVVEVDENTVQITPTAGMRIWIYCAELPWDPRDGPQGTRAPEAWCASKVMPDGEYGIIHPGQHEGEYRPLTKGMFLAAAALGWPDYE